MQKFKKLTFQLLDKQHLTILREIGRVIGVKASTAKNKETLIRDILDVQNGVIPPVPYSGRGAPPKIKVDISEFLEPEDYGGSYDDDEESDCKELSFRDAKSSDGTNVAEGVLEQHSSGYGFFRTRNYENGKNDVYVSVQNIKRYRLKRGDLVRCTYKLTREGDSVAMQEVISVNGKSLSEIKNRKDFDELIPYYPTERLKLETDDEDFTLRTIDLISPVGMGQRGLIVAPPKTGKTTILKKIAGAIEKNYPDVKLIILLVDERPEEVTDIKRSVKGEVVFSTFDETSEHHVRAAELVSNRAKRLVEDGQNVVILLDSITRLARAYNNVVESSGKTLSGGIDPVALQGPKRIFGSARNIEDGGSLTIISTALVETGSRMDDVIFEEFKGTGNMEIHLSRALSEKRVYPAIDIFKSGTRKEELLMSESELASVYRLRKILSMREENATDIFIEMLEKTKNNEDLLSKTDAWLKFYEK